MPKGYPIIPYTSEEKRSIGIKLSEALAGIVPSEESNRARSRTMKKKWTSPKYKREVGRAISKATSTPEARELKSEAARGVWTRRTPEEKEESLRLSFHSEVAKEHRIEALEQWGFSKMSRTMRDMWASMSLEEKEERLNISCRSRAAYDAHMEANQDPNRKIQLRKSMKEFWEGLSLEEKDEKLRNSFLKVQTPNETELALWGFLEERYLGMFIPTWIKRICIGGKYPDFVSTNGYRLLIESFGSYFHDPVMYPNRPTEEELVVLYKKEGYTCIIVWANSVEDIIFEWPGIVRQIDRVLEG